MTLREVFNVFSEDIAERVEQISYMDGADNFEMVCCFNDDDNNCIETHIWLFDNGDTALRVIDAPLGVIDDCIVDFYVKVRQEWKNSV